MNTDWTRLLRKKMQEHQGTPLPIDWAQVDALADKRAAVCHGRNRVLKWLSAAAVLLLLVGGGSLYFLATDSQKDVAKVTGNHNFQGTDSHSKAVNNNHATIVLAESMPAKTQQEQHNIASQENQHINKNIQDQHIIEDIQDQLLNDNQQDKRLTENTKDRQLSGKEQGRRAIEQKQPDHSFLADAGVKHKRGRMSLQLASSPNMSNRGSAESVLPVAGLFGDAPANMDSNGSLQLAGEELAPYFMEDHHQPLRFTLSCSYPINEHISLSAGISYSYLYSELSSHAKGYSSEGKQKLHFVGVPVAINWHFFSTGKLGLYLSGGAMAEKMVDGSVSTIERTGTNTLQNETSVLVNSLYWSVNASLGVDYGFHPSFALFGEVGSSHYINPSSKVATYYSEKPNSMSFNLGLRYRLP